VQSSRITCFESDKPHITAALSANDTIVTSPFSVAFLSPVNEVIDLDASCKAARRVPVPSEVFLVLWIYIAVTAGILGYPRPLA